MAEPIHSTDKNAITNTQPNSRYNIIGSWMPANACFFIVVEEVGKAGFLVRKILTTGQYAEIKPQIYGLFPKAANASTTIAEHVLGNNLSKFISASTNFPQGAPNFNGPSVYVDIQKATQAGVKIISSQEIIADLLRYKKMYPHTSTQIDKLIAAIRNVEGEVLLEPSHGRNVPPHAIVTPGQYRLYQGARVVQVFAIVLTAYHLGEAAYVSGKEGSVKPLAAEGIRQAGGWGGAWLGFKVGGSIGTAIGIESGPGALASGLIGGIIFGWAGYVGADWVADYVYKN